MEVDLEPFQTISDHVIVKIKVVYHFSETSGNLGQNVNGNTNFGSIDRKIFEIN